jgi:hypothetical protein
MSSVPRLQISAKFNYVGTRRLWAGAGVAGVAILIFDGRSVFGIVDDDS